MKIAIINSNAAIFIEAGEKSGLDPRYIFAHAAVEAGWECKSTLAKKHNYFCAFTGFLRALR